jgi:prefoldin alpha subunit
MPEEKKIQLTQNQAIGLLQNEQAKLEALEREFLQFRVTFEETLKAKETLNAVQKAKASESILIPLGAGVFVSAVLADQENVQVTLGGGILKKDSIPEALVKLENRRKETEEQLNAMQRQLEETTANVNNLSRVIQSAMQQQQAQRTGQSSNT